MPREKTGKIKGEVVREIHPHPGRRPELFIVISHSPHAVGDWQISNLQRSEAAAKDLVRRFDLGRATIVRIPAESGI